MTLSKAESDKTKSGHWRTWLTAHIFKIKLSLLLIEVMRVTIVLLIWKDGVELCNLCERISWQRYPLRLTFA